jgi:hypothetical protein
MIAAAALFVVAAAGAGVWPAIRPVAVAPHRAQPSPGVARAGTPAPTPTPAPEPVPAPGAAPEPQPPAVPGGGVGAQPPLQAPPPATPTPTAGSSSPPAGSTPGPPPTPTPAPPAPAALKPAFTASSGPGCGTSGAAALSFFTSGANGDWHATTGGAPGFGCGSPRYSHQSGSPTQWQNDADWVFTPGAGVSSCTFSIHVATGTWSASVLYEVYSGDTTNGFHGAAFASFHLDQHGLDAGGWASAGPFSSSSGTIDLAITDAGTDPHFGAVADVVKATCS